MSGCELVSTNINLLFQIDPTAPDPGLPTVVPIYFSNIRAQDSSVTVRLVPVPPSNQTQAPAAIKNRTSVEVVVENCTLTGSVDAFVVDVHNATSLNEVNLTLRDSTILNASRGAASVYRSALAVGAVGAAAPMSVWISVERSTIEVIGTPLGIRCGNDTVPGDYRNSGSATVPVLCPLFAASVLLSAPDTPTNVSAASIAPLNVTYVEIATKASNITVNSSSGSDSYATSVVRTGPRRSSVALKRTISM
jgi:hypothetical protein